MPWPGVFEDESNQYADAVLDYLTMATAVVSALWALEVANVLVVAERRGRIEPEKSSQFLNLLSRLPIHAEKTPPHRAFTDVVSLARRHRLSAYDAAYLDLAIRRRVPIATGDTKIRPVALTLGIPLLDTNGRDEA